MNNETNYFETLEDLLKASSINKQSIITKIIIYLLFMFFVHLLVILFFIKSIFTFNNPFLLLKSPNLIHKILIKNIFI